VADQTQRLLLQVDAATELLRRHLAEGEQPLTRFEQRADAMAKNVDRSIADMGKRFGSFAALAEDAATRAQRSFETSFSDVQKLASKAIQAPTVTGGLNVGAVDAREAAATAQRQALATRLIADAAERAAQGEGVLTEQTRLYVQAARAASIEAERHAQELAREAGALERVEIELAQAGAGARVFGTNQNRVTVQSGALRAAMQGASYQVQDTFTQLSMGANIFQVVAIQGGQLAGQFANIEGKAGSFARFMIGPWGLAITGALLELGPLTKGVFDFGNAVDDETDKLKDNAKTTAVAEQAKKAFLATEAGAIDDVRALTAEIKKQNDALKSNAELSNIRAKTDLKNLQDQRAPLAKQLEEARAALRATNSTAVGGIAGSGSVIQGQAAERVRALDERLKAVDASIAGAQAAVNSTRADLADEAAKRSIDPIAQINRRYEGPDGLIARAKQRAIAEGTVSTVLTRQLETLRAQQKAEVEAAQKRAAAVNRTPNNNQIGRDIDVAQATSIVASIGGHVTSGYRSKAEQSRIYADKLAGRHAGPVAKPGTSDHERGQAIDVAFGPGISEASIKAAFAKEGVAIKQLLTERNQKVFHVAFGKRGPSQQTIDNKVETARQKVLSDDIAYGQEEQAARQRLTAATRKSAQSEEDRYRETVAAINADADAQKGKIDLQQEKGLSKPRADNLRSLNEQTRKQQLQNAAADRALGILDQRSEAEQSNLESQLAVLRISEDMAITDRDRRRIGLQILEAEQEQRRLALERVRDTSKDPAAVVSAKRSLSALPALDKAERAQFDQRTASPLDAYRQRLKAATADTNASLEEIGVRGLGNLEDAVASAASKVLGLKGAFGDFVGNALADLARLAFKMAAIAALDALFPGSGAISKLLGKAGGGKIEGKAGGGKIHGPGTGTSDSILALIDGHKPLMVSNGESIVTADATSRFWPVIDAMNKGRFPGLASGGMIGSPSLANLRAPSLPPQARGGSGRERMQLDVRVKTEASPLLISTVQHTTLQTVGAAAEPIMAGAQSRTMRALRRPSLPGAPG